MSQAADVCIWSVKEKYFGIPVSKIARVGRAPIKMADLGVDIAGEVFGDFLPAGSKVHVPNYFSSDIQQKMTAVETGNAQFILVNQGAEYIAFIADRVLFIGQASAFKAIHGDFENLSAEKYFSRQIDMDTTSTGTIAVSENDSEMGTEVLSFKIKDEVFEVPLQQVVRLYSMKDLNYFQLLCDQATGYLFDGSTTVPVLSLGACSERASSRILTYKQDDLVLGVVVDEMLGIKTSQNSSSKNLSMEEILGTEIINKLCPAYEKIFPSPKKKLEQMNSNSSAVSVIKVDIGETVFIATELVVSIQLCRDLDLNVAKTFFYDQVEMPLVFLPKYYGFTESVSLEKNHRVLIVENDGVKMALVVMAVLEILQVDRASERQILNWSLNRYSEKFRADATGIINVADYRNSVSAPLHIFVRSSELVLR